MREQVYTIAGHRLRVAAHGDVAAQLSAAFLASCRFEPAAGDRAADAHLHVRSDGDTRDSRIVVRTPASRDVDVWIGSAREARLRTSLVALMSTAVHTALRGCALYGFHGAGLVRPSPAAGVLVAGASGSGKSTLALRLMQSGWRYLSDDAVLLYEGAAGVEMCGLRRPFAVSKRTLDALRLPALSAVLGRTLLTDPGKRWVDPEAAFPDQAVASARPERILFAELTGEAHSELLPMRPADALGRLIALCPWTGGEGGQYVRVLGRLSRQSRAWRLRAGRDLVDEPGRAAALLASID